MSDERWRPLPGWEGIYTVSDHGRVIRIARGNGTRPGAFLSPMVSPLGYLHVRLRFRGRAAKPLVHRLVALAFIGPSPSPRHEVNHKDGNPGNPHYLNLEWVTHAENNLHAYRVLGRAPVCNKGMAGGRAKLSDSQVLQIRARYAAGGTTQQRLADEFGVSQPMIGYIVRRASWTHI